MKCDRYVINLEQVGIMETWEEWLEKKRCGNSDQKGETNNKQNKSTKISIKIVPDLLTFRQYEHILNNMDNFDNPAGETGRIL